MGTLRKQGQKWRAEVCVRRVRRSKVCRTKSEGMAWITEQESALEEGPDHTVAQMFDRYKDTHATQKKRQTAEEQRCDRLSATLGHLSLQRLTSDDLARWRDNRLQEVSAATVRREWNLLSHALNVAVKEWEWLPANPLARLKRPATPKPRSRVWTDLEIETFLVAAGWPGDSLQARVGDCLLFALETGMRAGEIVSLTPAQIHDKHVHLPKTKNGSARDVPLTTKAREIGNLYKADLKPDQPVFGLTGSQLDALFRKARNRACLVDLRFHDARRTALTRLSKKLDALELARMSGHKDLRILLETYYQPSIKDLADNLD